MLLGTCHCGDVQIEMTRTPRTLTACNCSICRRYAAQWAYGSRRTVRITHRPSAVETYEYDNKTFRYIRCRRCGCVTHYERFNTADNDRIAVNARMLDSDAIASIPIRSLDVRAKGRT